MYRDLWVSGVITLKLETIYIKQIKTVPWRGWAVIAGRSPRRSPEDFCIWPPFLILPKPSEKDKAINCKICA